jgi:hypothetical protein
MADNKTKATEQSVEEFLNAIEDERKRKDSFTLLALMKEVTGLEPKMWGSSMIGFGSYHYKYNTGREGDMFLTGFSPRKANLTLYGVNDSEGSEALLSQLGKHTLGNSCLYIKRLDDVDLPTLKRLIEAGYQQAQQKEQGG